MRATKKIRRVLFVMVLVVAAAFAAANTKNIQQWFVEKKPEAVNTVTGNQKDPQQEALINEMMAWLKPFDTTNTSYFLDGLLTAIDKTDSANALNDVAYTVCKDGSRFYLRIGQTETINNSQHYFFIDHAAQKMLLGKSREVVQSPGVPVNQLYDFVTSEGFRFSKINGNGRLTTISMQNPEHISCKELSVQYDSAAHQVKRIFMRQADVTDPMNADKEKWITLVIKNWNDDPDANPYLGLQKFIQKKNDEWISTPAYKDYELINQ
jgi:hypothetical protein